MTDVSTQEAAESDRETDSEHLDEVPDGCGCTEIWEHLSDERAPLEDEE
ncbi:MAG: hypothetical protein ABEJ47_01620 [Halorhabdus sp.]